MSSKSKAQSFFHGNPGSFPSSSWVWVITRRFPSALALHHTTLDPSRHRHHPALTTANTGLNTEALLQRSSGWPLQLLRLRMALCHAVLTACEHLVCCAAVRLRAVLKLVVKSLRRRVCGGCSVFWANLQHRSVR